MGDFRIGWIISVCVSARETEREKGSVCLSNLKLFFSYKERSMGKKRNSSP